MNPFGPPAKLYQLEGFVLDLEAGQLRRDGVRVPLQDLPLRVLGILAVNAGRVVPREELQRRLWSEGEFTDFEDGLNTAIRKLRQALDDDPKTPRLIETVRGYGYRLLVTVEMFTAPTPKVVPRRSPEATSQTPEPPGGATAVTLSSPPLASWSGWTTQSRMIAAAAVAALLYVLWWAVRP